LFCLIFTELALAIVPIFVGRSQERLFSHVMTTQTIFQEPPRRHMFRAAIPRP